MKKTFDLLYPMIASLVLALQVELFNYVYDIFSYHITLWENHEKLSQFENSLIVKEVVFRTINSFLALFYISFIKEWVEGCQQDNCFYEVEIQIYMNLLANFLVHVFLFVVRILFYKWNKRGIKNSFKKRENLNFDPHTIYHLKACEEIDHILVPYIDILILFGNLVFFSVAAPLSPFIVFILLYLYKFMDNYSVIYLANSLKIEQSKGIEIYKKVFLIYCFAGIMISMSLVLFTNPTFSEVSSIDRFITLAVFENFILLVLYFVNLNFLPEWFDHLDSIKSLYHSKYYLKDFETLPHHEIVDKASQSAVMSSIVETVKSDMYYVTPYKINIRKDENKTLINDKDIGSISVIKK